MRSEMPRQAERWGAPTVTGWENNIKRLKQMCIEKIELTKQHMKSVFGLSQSEVDELFSPEYTSRVE